jgi:hypothetical protein
MVENRSFVCKLCVAGVTWKLSVAVHINVHVLQINVLHEE